MSHSGKGLVTATVEVLRPRFGAPPGLRSRLVQLAADTAASDMGGVVAIFQPQFEAPPGLRSRLVQLAAEMAPSEMERATSILRPQSEAPPGLRSRLVQLAADTAAPGAPRAEIKAPSVRPVGDRAVQSGVEATQGAEDRKSRSRESTWGARIASIVFLLVTPLVVYANFSDGGRAPVGAENMAESASPVGGASAKVAEPAGTIGTSLPAPTASVLQLAGLTPPESRAAAPSPAMAATVKARPSSPANGKAPARQSCKKNKFAVCIPNEKKDVLDSLVPAGSASATVRRASPPKEKAPAPPAQRFCKKNKFGTCILGERVLTETPF